MSWFGRWVPLVKQSEDRPDFTLLEKRIAELIAVDAEAAQHADALKAEVAKLAAMRAACVVPRQLDEESLDKLKEYAIPPLLHCIIVTFEQVLPPPSHAAQARAFLQDRVQVALHSHAARWRRVFQRPFCFKGRPGP